MGASRGSTLLISNGLQDAKIIDTYHIQANNLTIGLLYLLQLREEVPETRLGYDIVGSKDAHAVEFRGRVRICRKMAANDLVFLETACVSN